MAITPARQPSVSETMAFAVLFGAGIESLTKKVERVICQGQPLLQVTSPEQRAVAMAVLDAMASACVVGADQTLDSLLMLGLLLVCIGWMAVRRRDASCAVGTALVGVVLPRRMRPARH